MKPLFIILSFVASAATAIVGLRVVAPDTVDARQPADWVSGSTWTAGPAPSLPTTSSVVTVTSSTTSTTSTTTAPVTLPEPTTTTTAAAQATPKTTPPTPSTTVPATTPTSTTPTTTTTVAPVASGYYDAAFASRMFTLTNSSRTSAGEGTLAWSGSLAAHAEAWAKRMWEIGAIGHSDLGGLLGTWSTVGENVAKGHPTADAMHSAWMSSSGHRANILQSEFTHVGIAVWVDPTGTTWGVAVYGG